MRWILLLRRHTVTRCTVRLELLLRGRRRLEEFKGMMRCRILSRQIIKGLSWNSASLGSIELVADIN
jgi:hypothetical protein